MININLIAERRARRLREMMILRVSALSVIGLTIVMVLSISAAGVLGMTARKNLRQINARLEDQKPRYEEWQRVQAEIEARQPVVALLEQVQQSEGAWMTILGDLSRIIPHEVVLDGFGSIIEKEGVTVRINGRARDEKIVAAFMLAFRQQTNWAGTPVLKNITGESKTDASGETMERTSVRFELTVPVRGMVGGDL